MQQLTPPNLLAATPRPIAEVLWPRPSLAGCILGTFVRDTRGCGLTSVDRMNYFSAGPYCVVSWFIEGQAYVVDWSFQPETPGALSTLPKLLFIGPQRNPTPVGIPARSTPS
jgi:hypothetical protein